MKVISVLRSALLVAAMVGLCVTDAKKGVKLCDADHPAPTPAKTNASPAKETTTPVVMPTVMPAPEAKPTSAPKPTAASDADSGAPGKVTPAEPAATPAPGPAPGQAPATPASTPAPAPAPAPAGGSATNAGTIKASFAYKGADAGGPGSYDMVTDINTCSKTPHAMYSPVSPLDDDLTFVFRGPMTIHNIAVFDGASGAWNKVSSFEKGGAANNLVFMNNRNIDYGGKSAPQGFASADGRGNAKAKMAFSGELGSATSPNGFSIYADEKTGAEVNIFQDKKCGQDGDCKGYYDKDGTAHIGWGGGKKIFITKVQMPHGGAPNLPAIWALNGQIVRSNQYQCNCRGVGAAGGCGELDIAEVIEKDVNVMATHYYRYAGGTGHDSWCKRPTDAPTTYITVIDESFGVKVIEIGANDFDFGSGSISKDVVAKWLSS